MLYDRTGAAYELDHEVDGIAYVRPMVRFVTQATTYHGDDFHEEEGFEPADFLVARNKADLFDAPPVEKVDAEIKAKRGELQALISEAKRQEKAALDAKRKAERGQERAERNLANWMEKHKVMTDLGKLLDGQVLYPLSVRENHYHKARDIPRIPDMRSAKYLSIHSGDFEKGQKWVCRQYSEDSYGNPFMFFDTEEDRAAVIASEFATTCDHFRANPSFGDPSYTTTTRLSYTTLQQWVEVHSSLKIPDDIEAMKVEHDAAVAKAKRDKLAAELAAIDAQA